MEGYGPASYGDGFADVYDDWYAGITDADATAQFVASWAAEVPGRPVVELGVGTGRLARPLRARGVAVVGLDASGAMLARCRRTTPGVAVVLADMASPPLRPAGASVVLVAFNTLFNLPDDDTQRRALTRAAGIVAPSGVVIVEAFVPGDGAAEASERIDVVRLDAGLVVLRVSRTDPAQGTVSGQHVELRQGEPVRLRPWHLRFRSPDELDELATSAGLRLRERWGGWSHERFHEGSGTHVSVYAPSAAVHR